MCSNRGKWGRCAKTDKTLWLCNKREEGGKLDPAELVKLRVRYLTEGVVLGDKAFVEGVFESQREIFSPKRKTEAKRIRESESPIYSLRQLRLRAVE